MNFFFVDGVRRLLLWVYLFYQVHVAESLINDDGVSSPKVAILSPYREQQARIRKALGKTSQRKDIHVTTIAKSQGKATFV